MRFDRLGGSGGGAGVGGGGACGILGTELGRGGSFFGDERLNAVRPMSDEERDADVTGPNIDCPNGGRENGSCWKPLRGGVGARSSTKGFRSSGACKGGFAGEP